MTTDALTLRALEAGRDQAAATVEERTRALARRSVAVRRTLILRESAAGPRLAAPTAPRIDPQFLAAVAREPSVDVVVAEGDSWFDYPFFDVLKLLDDEFGYDVRHVAHKGDRVEDMAYGGKGATNDSAQLQALTRLIEELVRNERLPRAILLSGGGNDIAGAGFAMLLEHQSSVAAGLNDQVVSAVIDQRLRLSFVTLLSAITRVCELRSGNRIPILLHGYDYPVPDGRGFFGGWSFLPGPWLEPGFRQKGFHDLVVRIGILRTLIDRFNEMLRGIVALSEFAHVIHVDLRGTLSTDSGYRELWDNELHPTREGFLRVTAKIAKVLGALPR